MKGNLPPYELHVGTDLWTKTGHLQNCWVVIGNRILFGDLALDATYHILEGFWLNEGDLVKLGGLFLG